MGDMGEWRLNEVGNWVCDVDGSDESSMLLPRCDAPGVRLISYRRGDVDRGWHQAVWENNAVRTLGFFGDVDEAMSFVSDVWSVLVAAAS